MRTAEEGAADVAARITILEQPSAGAKQLKLPVVPQGFTVKIAASSLPSVIQTDGTILPPSKETAVTLELEVTRSSDDSKAMTQPLTVHVPGYTPSRADPARMVQVEVLMEARAIPEDNRGLVLQHQGILRQNLNHKKIVPFLS